jgi:predicted component of type VI protein secretion system
MAEDSLRELLARLHQQLGSSGRTLDTEARQLLTTVMRDIERTLDPSAAAAEESGAPAAAHTPRLESLAVRFEAGHPALAEALRELIDALVKAGI